MKVLVISDIHGRTIWEDIVRMEEHEVDKIVFMGDYFDPYEDIPIEVLVHNFEQIINYGYGSTDKVHLLAGNHDFCYLPGQTEKYTRFDFQNASTIKDIFTVYGDDLSACFNFDRYLFSHAGVSKTWCENHDIVMDEYIALNINKRFIHNPEAFSFGTNFRMSPTGNDISQSPFWIRPQALLSDGLKDYIHVVGHTRVKSVSQIVNVIMTDALSIDSGEYCIIDTIDRTFETKNIARET